MPDLTQRFEFDPRAERDATLLRASAACVVLIAGAWLMALPYLVPRAFALVGFVFATHWLLSTLRTRREKPEKGTRYLELNAAGLRLCDGGEPVLVAWQEVESIAIDRDRLNVVVARRDAPNLEIEPRYQGLTLDTLAETVAEALALSRTKTPCQDALGAPDG